MAVWRCPHCATPQAEASRCWVCRRSTTSCATCRHFRRGVANGLGVCGLDPRRHALRGTEMRACWTVQEPAQELPATGGPGRVTGGSGDDEARRPRTFVPVEDLAAVREPLPVMAHPVNVPARVPAPGTGWSLWGEPEG